jgi:alkanesulfonate monooxygenase SsuD/methylene tetrahydromethanopterin reductase-like flavin-dependent oxidoreductase (luciferase family)
LASIPTQIGVSVQHSLVSLDLERSKALLRLADQAGLDHVMVGDHVTWRGGGGFDGLIHATAALVAQPRLEVHLGLYLLPLRHPVPVARQIADIARLAPSRLVLGVGIGGDDRHEVEACGVDPRTRGRRADESLTILRSLLRGDIVDMRGAFFALHDVMIRPTPSPSVPIMVGGRSDAALRRVATHGDGWLALWTSPRRFAEAVSKIDEYAARIGRTVPWAHGINIWTGFGPDESHARRHLGEVMRDWYGLPFEQFERWSPLGPPTAAADLVHAYVEAGACRITLAAHAATPEEAVEQVGEVRRLVLTS